METKSIRQRIMEYLAQAYWLIKQTLRWTIILAPAIGGFYLIWRHYVPPEDSEFIKRIKQMDNYGIAYAGELIDGDWDVICLLRATNGITSWHYRKKYRYLHDRIPQLGLYSESAWHVVFANKEHVSKIATNRRHAVDAGYDEFFKQTIQKFATMGFSPQECADFD